MKLWKEFSSIMIMAFMLGSLSSCLQKPNELTGTDWALVALDGNELIPGTSITLQFSEEHLGGQMDCNGYGGTPNSGGYQIGNKGQFSLGEILAVTVQLCSEPEGIMEQENAYIEALMSVVHYRVSADLLVLDNEDGETLLVFEK